MESTSLLRSSPLISSRPFAGNFYPRRMRVISRIPVSNYANYNHNFDGKLVDESMIVLRMRIHEMKAAERNEEEAAPSHWMEWERRYCAMYDSDACEAVGLLQSKLMETRPSLALRVAVVVMLSVPTSAVMVLSYLASAIGDYMFK